jgi:hypothetical protein
MNQRKRFFRKIAYACAIAALLLPLSWLSAPATRQADGRSSKGGVLAQMREDHHLSQATLGEIDPASETIKLATLGMRGVAANLLWQKANDFRKREDWVSLSATLEQIAKLQPNFVSVWIYQGWNLSYNISVEFDDYHDRYYWVIRGIDFLKEGATYNTKEPRLASEIGNTIAQKIGRADEHVQFRRLFREDDDFHGARPRAQRDNWLVGREVLLEAENWVDQEGLTIKGKSPLLFHSHPVMCLINYSEALEEEGTFGEVAKNAWQKAAESWKQFANRDLPTQDNMLIRLADMEHYVERSLQSQAELEKLIPAGLRDQIFAEKLAALPAEQRETFETPAEDRTPEQNAMMYAIEGGLEISHLEIADRIEGENRAAALKLAEEAMQDDFMARTIDIDRGIVNYGYWTQRCQVEPQDDTLEARKAVYDADQAFTAAQLLKARELYEHGWTKWRDVIDANEFIVQDSNHVDELSSSIANYIALLHQLDEQLPQPFILQDVLEANELYSGRTIPDAPKSQAEEADPGEQQPDPPAEPAAPLPPASEEAG